MNRKINLLTATALALALIPAVASAQAANDTRPTSTKPAETHAPEAHHWEPPYNTFVTKTYFLTNTFEQNDANEILIAIRNMLQPWVKIYFDYGGNAIVLSAPPDQQALAQKVIADLDRPRKSYRLTFTLKESDAGKSVGVQHFALTVVSGQRTTLKQGSKIPIVTGTSSTEQTQFQYIDVGMNFDVTLNALPGGLRLRSKVEQSSLADDHMPGSLSQDPIVRQTVLEGTSLLTPGKPLTLGSIDIPGVPGSIHHLDIEVIAQPVTD